VVPAHEPSALAKLLCDDGRAPVATGIVEGVDRAAFRVHDKHRLASILPQAEAAGLRYFVEVAGEKPALSPDVLLFKIEKARIGVPSPGISGNSGNPIGGALRPASYSIRLRKVRISCCCTGL